MPLSQTVTFPPRRKGRLSSCRKQEEDISSNLCATTHKLKLGHISLKAQNNILNSIYSFYLFEQRVSAEFLHPDLSGAQVPHILIHDRLHVHGAVQAALQLAEQRRQGPWQEARLWTAACETEVET